VILQIPLLAAEAIETAGTLLRGRGGPNLSIFPGGTFTLGGFLVQSVQRLFRRRSPRLSGTNRAIVLRAIQRAKITRDPIIRSRDPFTGGLAISSQSQAASGLVPQLLLEAARRREVGRLRPIFREVRPDFSRQRVSEIQRFFESLPTAEERAGRGQQGPPPPGSKRFRSAIAAGIRTR